MWEVNLEYLPKSYAKIIYPGKKEVMNVFYECFPELKMFVFRHSAVVFFIYLFFWSRGEGGLHFLVLTSQSN